VLTWVKGRVCDPTEVDRVFRLREPRRIRTTGCVRFRHWRRYAERGLAGWPAAVWIDDETLTIEHATETLAQYQVGAPRLYATLACIPQPFLPQLDETEWHPAQRQAPYRPRRQRVKAGRQAPRLATTCWLFREVGEAGHWWEILPSVDHNPSGVATPFHQDGGRARKSWRGLSHRHPIEGWRTSVTETASPPLALCTRRWSPEIEHQSIFRRDDGLARPLPQETIADRSAICPSCLAEARARSETYDASSPQSVHPGGTRGSGR
jgi:hypothetical protein